MHTHMINLDSTLSTYFQCELETDHAMQRMQWTWAGAHTLRVCVCWFVCDCAAMRQHGGGVEETIERHSTTCNCQSAHTPNSSAQFDDCRNYYLLAIWPLCSRRHCRHHHRQRSQPILYVYIYVSLRDNCSVLSPAHRSLKYVLLLCFFYFFFILVVFEFPKLRARIAAE